MKRESLVASILVFVGIIRLFFFLPEPPKAYYESLDKQVTFSGMISEYKDVRENQTFYTITPANQKFNVLVPNFNKSTSLNYGDMVTVTGTLALPESFETDTGRTFDYGKYLLAHDTFFIIKNAQIEKTDERGNRIKKILFSFREKFENSLSRILPIRDAGFINGLLLGSKGGINDEDKDAFVRTGTIHIVALSGFNVMIVAEAFMRIIGLFSIGMISYISGGIAILLFVIMAGAGSTAIRAGLMAIIALVARSTGRTYLALRALVIVSLLMFAFNPRVIFDVSFHLSVLATFGVITLPAKIVRYFRWIPTANGFREIILATVSAMIVVVPYIMYVMGNLSLVALFANAFILPFIPLIMLFGFIAGFIGLFTSAIAMPFAYMTHIGSVYTFSVAHFLSDLPFASLIIAKFPLIILLGFYALLLWWIFSKIDKTS